MRPAPTVVQFTEPFRVELVEAARQELPAGHLRLRTWFSGISAGTELTAYRGSNPYLTKHWDADRGLFVEGPPTFAYPVSGWGYSEVGEVVEVTDDVTTAAPGDVVAGIWGHRSEGVVAAATPSWNLLPTGVEAIHGVFARVGAIALNAALAAGSRIGEHVAVFGQGVIGLLATQLVRLGGSRVVAVDALESRLELARQLGAQDCVPADAPGGAGLAIRDLTAGRGVDSAIELSGSYRALHEAVRSVVTDGKVVAAGFYQGEAEGLRLGEEFHLNRVRILASQIGGPPPELAGRWDQRRLVVTFLGQLAGGNVRVDDLVSHVIAAHDVASAFQLLDQSRAEALQVVLRFPGAPW